MTQTNCGAFSGSPVSRRPRARCKTQFRHCYCYLTSNSAVESVECSKSTESDNVQSNEIFDTHRPCFDRPYQATMSDDNRHDVDNILTELGTGKFQIVNYAFICLAAIFTTMNSTTFVFTARDTSYRCAIAECESPAGDFDAPWLINAFPFQDGVPLKCEHFPLVNRSSRGANDDTCIQERFDNSSLKACKAWIYGEGDTIVKGFDIPCEDWKRSLVGTTNAAGQLVSLLFSGYLSDKYGRRNIMIAMTVATGVIGLIQSFSKNYWFFLVLEFLNLAASAGAYASTYVLGIEILSPGNRVYGSATMNTACTIATLILGLLAWATPSWRSLLLATNLPSFTLLLALFAIPESVRWLNAKGDKRKCAAVLRKAAKMNNVSFTDESIAELEKMETFEISAISDKLEEPLNVKIAEKEVSLMAMLKTPQLLVRLLICAFCWFTNVFVYFGLSLNAVNISGNEKDVYINFILATVVEFPGIITYLLILRYLGRKYSLFSTLFLSGVACVVYAVAPNIKGTLALIIYLFSKLFIAMAFAMVYIVTSELFPTTIRNSTMNFCSVVGRIGGILAPQVPLLHKVHPSLPMLTYGIFPIISAFTLLNLPETRNKKLPDTLKEAEDLS